MSYDPTDDPRYVPYDRTQILERELESLEGDLDVLAEAERRLRDIFAMTETPGWAYFSSNVQDNADVVDKALRRTTDPHEWALLRGEKLAYDFILQTPEAVMGTMRKIGHRQNELHDKTNRKRGEIESV